MNRNSRATLRDDASPHDLEGLEEVWREERRLVGALLVQPTRILDLEIDDDDLADTRHRLVLASVRRVAARAGGVHDVVDDLRAHGLVDRVGGLQWIGNLYDDGTGSGDIEALVKRVRIASRLRRAANIQAAHGRQLISRRAAQEIAALLGEVDRIMAGAADAR